MSSNDDYRREEYRREQAREDARREAYRAEQRRTDPLFNDDLFDDQQKAALEQLNRHHALDVTMNIDGGLSYRLEQWFGEVKKSKEPVKLPPLDERKMSSPTKAEVSPKTSSEELPSKESDVVKMARDVLITMGKQADRINEEMMQIIHHEEVKEPFRTRLSAELKANRFIISEDDVLSYLETVNRYQVECFTPGLGALRAKLQDKLQVAMTIKKLMSFIKSQNKSNAG